MTFVEEDLFSYAEVVKHIVLEISQRLCLVSKKFQGKFKGKNNKEEK